MTTRPIIVTGGPLLSVTRAWWPALDAVATDLGATTVWHRARSAAKADLVQPDHGIDLWARARGYHVAQFPAPHREYLKVGLPDKKAVFRGCFDIIRGRRSYLVRPGFKGDGQVWTQQLANTQPVALVCLPGRSDSKTLRDMAKELGLEIRTVPMVYEPGSPAVVNVHHYAPMGSVRDSRPPLPEGFRYIGRNASLGGPSPLANPYTKREHGIGALDLYKGWLWDRMKTGDRRVLDEIESIEPGDALVCHCKDVDGYGACHGDIVVAAWRWLRDRKAA